MHVNQPTCPKCLGIINRYPNPHPYLAKWAVAFKAQYPEAHLSAFGRGEAEQEDDFKHHVSKARYGQSAHNYNAACDWWRLTVNGAAFDRPWFQHTLGAVTDPFLLWGGSFTSFPDYPHIEIRGWQTAAKSGLLSLVEPA